MVVYFPVGIFLSTLPDFTISISFRLAFPSKTICTHFLVMPADRLEKHSLLFSDSVWQVMIFPIKIPPVYAYSPGMCAAGMSSRQRKLDASGHRLPMLKLVGKQNADILCFQEFYEPADTAKSNIRYIQRELHFPYYFFSRDFRFRINKYELGTIIFSKYPIIKTYQTRFSADTTIKTESLIATDIDVNHKIIRIYTTHLQSVLFKAKDFRNVEIIRNAEDSMLQASRSLAKKLKGALGLRGYQADTVRRQLDACTVPYVICGDFNDVPNSYTYFHIRGDLQDAFIAKSFGIGRSYIHISPTLRIDYILPSKEFKIIQTMKLASPYSDHHAVHHRSAVTGVKAINVYI